MRPINEGNTPLKRKYGLPPTLYVSTAAIMFFAFLLVFAPLLTAEQIVDHPDKLKFEDLEYSPPHQKDFRHQLKCGATVYLAENREVPTFDLTVIIGTGAMYEPPEKAGLADMTGYLMRNGGFTGKTASELDERLAFLAGEISVTISATQGTAQLFCLSKDIDEGLELLRGVLRSPVFDQEAIDRYRSDVLSTLRQRNNETSSIERREWQFLMYNDHPSTIPYRRTEKSISSIMREDMIEFHSRYFFPQNFTFAVSGDFKTKEILKKLETMLAGWPGQKPELPKIPDRLPNPAPGVYIIEKEDVNQSRISIGHIGVKRENPDQFPITIMNDILGGGGFTSRIVKRVRSDEGLAYSVRSTFNKPVLFPGTFRAAFQTKHATAAFGTKLIMDEINRIRTEKVSDEELEISKSSFISDLVNPFSSKKAIVNTFASDDYTGRPDDYWQDYEVKMSAVTADDVLRVAREYLHPDKTVFLVVGDPEAVQEGWDKDQVRFTEFGEITILPLRDPLTLE
jgi:predicted Zn-dependent peptidase